MPRDGMVYQMGFITRWLHQENKTTPNAESNRLHFELSSNAPRENSIPTMRFEHLINTLDHPARCACLMRCSFPGCKFTCAVQYFQPHLIRRVDNNLFPFHVAYRVTLLHAFPFACSVPRQRERRLGTSPAAPRQRARRCHAEPPHLGLVHRAGPVVQQLGA